MINSLFILRNYCGRGIGAAAALRLWELYPGRYCCGQLTSNASAVRFWQQVYARRRLAVFELEREAGGNRLVEQYFAV